MIFSFSVKNRKFEVNTSEPLDISIPLVFDGSQPSIYGADKASSMACEIGSFIGDTRKGGSCNFEEYKFIPHCNGTHTECVGHITFERIFVNEILKEFFFLACLISVKPQLGKDTIDNYFPLKENNDLLITQQSVMNLLDNNYMEGMDALIIRTLPNDEGKKHRNYSEYLPAYFSLDAIDYINSLKINHLLVDFPSVDRLYDEGHMSVHHKFWNVPDSSHNLVTNDFILKTITEMIYVPDYIVDGWYLLNLNIANFSADASPSRPILYKTN